MKTTFTTQHNATSTLNGSHSTHNVYSPLRRLTLLVTLLMTFALGARAQATITEGVYLIKCYTAQDLYLKPVSNAASSFLTVSRTKSGEVLWKVEAVDNNRYRIQHVATGLYIYRNGDVGINESVQLSATNNNNLNYFYFYTNDNYPGAYAIAPYDNTDYSFNIWGGRAEGNTIGLYTHPDDGHSMWMLENPKVPTPVITIDGDGYATISCSLAGVTFRYTINGDTPTVASAVYDGNNKPKLNDGDRIRVLGTLQNYDDSDEASMVANVVAPVPTITIADDGTVSIASTLADAVIYYTVDGEVPTETSTVYHAPFKVEDKTLVRAIAVKSGYYQSSPVASRYYSTSTAALQGDGTEASPYLIASMDEWIAFANQANADPTQKYHVRLAGDISGYNVLVDRFTGVLDGQYHIVSGLIAPLFASTDGATIKNVVLDKVNISGTGNVGALVGTASGATRIYNCGVLSGTVGGGTVGGGTNVGSIAGELQGSARVVNCYSFADITGGTTVGGIVGYNTTASTSANLQTLIMNCMFYGNIEGGTNKAPIYNGKIITNAGATGINNYNYYRYSSPYSLNKDINTYNCALAAEERYLVRHEFYRGVLNSQRKLCAFYVTGNVSGTDEIGKWVLDKSIAPYPIIKPWGKYPSLINKAPTDPNTPYQGKVLGNLSVNISGHGTVSLPITDMDTLNYDYNYYKVQLPYYNDYFNDNYTNGRIVTGWKITDITGGTTGIFSTTGDNQYNFADRNCTEKDLYNVSGRVFAQGSYYNVPEGVTAISIEPYWGKAVYLCDANYDEVYNTEYSGTHFILAGNSPGEYNGSTVYHSLSYVWSHLDGSKTIYDNAIVLVGNYHTYDESWNTNTVPFTIMSVDEDKDNEPDYCLYQHFNNRKPINPARFDFLCVPAIGMAAKVTGSGLKMPNQGIYQPQGWFEITETCLIRFTEFEYDNGKGTASPMILNNGIFEQFISGFGSNATNTSYMQLGGNVYFESFTPGTHTDYDASTKRSPLSITGGEYKVFYMSGEKASAQTQAGNALCYSNGGLFHTYASAYMEEINGDVIVKMDHSIVKEFYGGGMKESTEAQIKGSIDITINNSIVGFYCGGPKFGKVADGKTVTTKATGTTFGKFYGAGYGGTSYTIVKPVTNDPRGSAYKRELYNNYTFKTTTTDGILVDYHLDFFTYAGAVGELVSRFFNHYAKLSLATTNNVSSTLVGCTVKGDFYGGGCLGEVNGDATSVLRNCVIEGNAFGGGFSASIPTCIVRKAAPDEVPTYDEDAGVFNKDVLPDYELYTWSKEVTEVDDANGLLPADEETLNKLGQVTGNTIITIEGNTRIAENTESGVYGGGNESRVTGTTTVHINATDGGNRINNVFGGANQADVDGATTVNINSGNIGNVFGANNKSGTKGSTIEVNVKGATSDYVYGAGNLAAYTGNPVVNMSAGTVKNALYGGGLGETAVVTGNTQVNMTGGTVGYTEKVDGKDVVRGGDVFGGGNAAAVDGNTGVTITAGEVKRNVYGGGNQANVSGKTNVVIGQ